MKKLFFLTICIVMMGVAQSFAQTSCNAQYTTAPSPGTSSNALRVVFDNTSTGSSGPATYYTTSKIFFGDGASEYIDAELFHNYATTGTYSTMLVVKTIDSFTSNVVCSDTAYHQITVNYSACAFAISAQANGGGSTTFSVSNLGGGALPTTSSWDFGDGTTGTMADERQETAEIAGADMIRDRHRAVAHVRREHLREQRGDRAVGRARQGHQHHQRREHLGGLAQREANLGELVS